jgi:hypothetical protein
VLSRRPLSSSRIRCTTSSSSFFSRPSSCARFGSFQTPESSSARLTSISRCSFVSTSKIPPQRGLAGGEVGDRGGDLVQAFGFHR